VSKERQNILAEESRKVTAMTDDDDYLEEGEEAGR
jgi:hypothetical protein